MPDLRLEVDDRNDINSTVPDLRLPVNKKCFTWFTNVILLIMSVCKLSFIFCAQKVFKFFKKYIIIFPQI